MKNGMVIIAADGHAVDSEPVYRERLRAAYRQRAMILRIPVNVISHTG